MHVLIDQQIHLPGTKDPNVHLVSTSGPGGTSLTWSGLYGQAYMVLSGGLGSSESIQRRLEARYGTAVGTNYPNARGMQILLAADP
jgi:hypothetical protein